METSTSVDEAGAGQEVLEATQCRHQWVIDMPAGPSSKGMCRTCGEVKQFQNYIEGSSWGYDITLEQLSGASRFPTKKDIPDDVSSGEDE